MISYNDSVINKFDDPESGNAAVGATVTVRDATTGAKAAIYSDNGITAISNPLTVDDYGNYTFFASSGTYDLVINEGLPSERVVSKVSIFETDSLRYDNVAAMTAVTIPLGSSVTCDRYYDGGEIVAGLSYICLTPAQYGGTPDGYIDHYDDAGNVLKLVNNGAIDQKHAGATGDGSTDDTSAIEAADSFSGDVSVSLGDYLFNGENIANIGDFDISDKATFKNSIYTGIVQKDAGVNWLHHNHLEQGVGTGVVTSGNIPHPPVYTGDKQRQIDVVAYWYNDFGLDAVRQAGGAIGSTQWYYWSWLFHGAAGDGYEAKRHSWLGYYRGDDPAVLDWQSYWLNEAGVTSVILQPRASLSGYAASWMNSSDPNYWLYQLLNNAPNFKQLQYALWVDSSSNSTDTSNKTAIEASFDDVISIYSSYGNVYTYNYLGKVYAVVFAYDVSNWRGAYDSYSGSANTITMLKAQAVKFQAAGFDGVCVFGRNNSSDLCGNEDLLDNGVITFNVGYTDVYDPANNGSVSPAVDYEDLAIGVAARPSSSIAYKWSIPAVSTDRDSHSYHPSTWNWTGSTPELFEKMCRNAIRRMQLRGTPRVMTVYNVTEHAEGGAALQPNMRDGKGYLHALRNALNGVAVSGDSTVSDGTFTPTLEDAATGGNVATPSLSYGTYVRSGKSCTVSVTLTNINTAGLTAGNSIYIKGLPFAAENLSGSLQKWIGACRLNDVAFNGSVCCQIDENTDYIKLYDSDGAGADAELLVSSLTSGASDIYLSLTYRID